MAKQTAPVTVWVPPGSTLLTSPGIEVRTMAPGESKVDIGRSTLPSTPSRQRAKVVPPSPQPDTRGGANWRIHPGQAAPQGTPAATVGDLESEQAYVTPELLAIADQVMSRYDMQVSGMTFITAKPDKGGAIWRIETDRGPRSLKQLHRPAPRSLFSVGAQEYLHEQGARVPALIRSKDGVPYVERDGKLWIVTEWVEPLYPASKIDLEGAGALCYGLGEFHRHTKGYVPPKGAQKASRLYRWPKTYAKVATKIGWIRIIAQAYAEMDASGLLLSVVDQYEQQARDAYDRLMRSPYPRLVERGEQAWGLAHQDERRQSARDGSGA